MRGPESILFSESRVHVCSPMVPFCSLACGDIMCHKEPHRAWEGRAPAQPDHLKGATGFTAQPCPSCVPAVLGAGNEKDPQLQVRQDRPLLMRSPELRAGVHLGAARGQHKEHKLPVSGTQFSHLSKQTPVQDLKKLNQFTTLMPVNSCGRKNINPL